LHRLSPGQFRFRIDAKWQPPRVRPRFTSQARFWGKVRNDRIAKIAPAGWPKSDCTVRQAEKCGATMAVTVHPKLQVCAEAALTIAMVREKFTAMAIVAKGSPKNRPRRQIEVRN
jgi:hypothetical protein